MGEVAHGDDGVAENAKVRTAAELFDGVLVIGFTGIEVRDECRSEVAACTGSHDAATFGIDVPFLGLRAHETHAACGVVEHARVAVTRRAESVFQHDAGDAIFGEPCGIARAFMRCESAVAAAGANEYRSGGRCCVLRQIRGQGRDVFFRCATCIAGSVRIKRNRGQRIGRQSHGGHEREEKHELFHGTYGSFPSHLVKEDESGNFLEHGLVGKVAVGIDGVLLLTAHLAFQGAAEYGILVEFVCEQGEGFEGLGGNVVLHAFYIAVDRFLVEAEVAEEAGQDFVALDDVLGEVAALGRKNHAAVFFVDHQAIGSESLQHGGNTGLGNPEIGGNIHRPSIALLSDKVKNLL